MSLDYTIYVPIGDWANDGHGHCRYFCFSSSHSLSDCRSAYVQSSKEHERIAPHHFFKRDGDSLSSEDCWQIAQRCGVGVFPDELSPEDDPIEFILWWLVEFIRLSLPSLTWRREDFAILPWVGEIDAEHSPNLGYGLF